MSVVIKTIKDYFNNYVYPKTKTKAVYDDSNNRLDTTLSTVVHFDNDSSSGTISDPVLKQSDIATTLGTSDTVPASQKLVNTVNTTLGSASSASAVTGADAFSKISTLNSQLTSLIAVEESDYYSVTIGAQTYNTQNCPAPAKTGYTPIIAFVSQINLDAVITSVSFNTGHNQFRCQLFNAHVAAQTATFKIGYIYLKTS